MANKAGGKGYENVEYYTNCKLMFHAIHNIHTMRDSLAALLKGLGAGQGRRGGKRIVIKDAYLTTLCWNACVYKNKGGDDCIFKRKY